MIVCQHCGRRNEGAVSTPGTVVFCTYCMHPLETTASISAGPPLATRGIGMARMTLGAEKGGEARARCPSGALWLYYLFFRPRVFFTHFVVDPVPLLTALCAWLYGMAGVIDQFDTRLVTGRGLPFVIGSWSIYWTAVVLGGAWGGVLYFWFGGWWFRVRLQWSGAESPDKGLARRVYLFASQVYVLPILAVALIEASHYSSPQAAATGEGGWWYLPLIASPIWSVWNSYVGVRTAFMVRKWAAAMWFFVLPGVFYMVGVLIVIGALIVSEFGAADTSSPQVHDSTTMTFSYPGNWWIDTEDDDYDPEANVSVEPFQEAWIHILLYASDLDPETEVQGSLDGFRSGMAHEVEGGVFEAWGVLKGNGRILLGKIKGTPVRLRVFVTPVGGEHLLEVQEMCVEEDAEAVEPGFELIRSTFRLKP